MLEELLPETATVVLREGGAGHIHSGLGALRRAWDVRSQMLVVPCGFCDSLLDLSCFKLGRGWLECVDRTVELIGGAFGLAQWHSLSSGASGFDSYFLTF